MCRRYIRGLLLVIGSALVLFATLPILAFVHFEESLQTELMASKLVLLPVGAICLAGAAMLGTHEVRH
jgi:predicted permease